MRHPSIDPAGPAALAELLAPIRHRLVATLVADLEAGTRTEHDVLDMLAAGGLTADPVALHVAITAVDDPSYAAAIATLASPGPVNIGALVRVGFVEGLSVTVGVA